MVEKKDKHRCNGCKLCGEICPVRAISYENDNEGFWYPKFDDEKCIKCGLCLKECPIESQKEYHRLQKGYAGWAKDDSIRRRSTSGGIYEMLARKMLDEKGYLAASRYTGDFRAAFHTIGNTEDDLKRFIGSKYFQSDTAEIYCKVKKLLESGEKVLFTGTPCQVAALDSFLGKAYDNLITCDFICRGVPSPKMQKKKIDYFESKYRSKVIHYRDKSKFKSWSYFGEKIDFKNGKSLFISRYKDWFNNCFIKYNFNVRPSCYECKYKADNHAADITIGDFWGITDVTEKDLRDGVSAIITNTVKGDLFIKSLRQDIYICRHKIDEISSGNPAYAASIVEPDGRDHFFEDVDRLPLKKAVYKNCRIHPLKEWLASSRTLLIGGIKNYKDLIIFAKDINWYKFIRYNFMCRNIKRDAYCFLVPIGKCNIHIEKNAEIILHGNVLLNFYPCYKTNSMTNFVVRNGAVFIANNRVEISYNNTVAVNENANLTMGYLFTGVSASIVCNHKMTIGNHVMLGRDVALFDSDYHPIFDESYEEAVNGDKELIIEDNVWIGAKSMVLKGAHLRYGTIIGANSTVMAETEEYHCFITKKEGKTVGKEMHWRR